MQNRGSPRVALVLPGRGARGAYEAGALSILLPALERRGERVSIVCGTSVGAINAALVGSLADRPLAEIAEIASDRWRSVCGGDVLRPIVGPGLAIKALRFLGEALEAGRAALVAARPRAPAREPRALDRLAVAAPQRQAGRDRCDLRGGYGGRTRRA
jgi:NTE family protein